MEQNSTHKRVTPQEREQLNNLTARINRARRMDLLSVLRTMPGQEKAVAALEEELGFVAEKKSPAKKK